MLWNEDQIRLHYYGVMSLTHVRSNEGSVQLDSEERFSLQTTEKHIILSKLRLVLCLLDFILLGKMFVLTHSLDSHTGNAASSALSKFRSILGK